MTERQAQADDERLPMTMHATVAHVPHAEMEDVPDGAGMIRIPITIHIRLSDLS